MWRRIEQSQHAQRCDQHRDQAHSAQPPRSRDRHIFASSTPARSAVPLSSSRGSKLFLEPTRSSSRFDPRFDRRPSQSSRNSSSSSSKISSFVEKKERKREKSILSLFVWPRIGLDSGRTTRRESRKRLTSFSDILHYLGRHARGSGFERHTIVGRSVTGMKSISAPK